MGFVGVGLVGIGLLAVAMPAAAQAPPVDAGQLQRQAEQAVSRPGPAPPPAAAPANAPVQEAAPVFHVRRFLVRGATLVPTATLERELDAYLDRPLDFAELQVALRGLVALYRRHGWFARVQLPEQDITEGTLVVQVVEGRFGQLQVQAEGTRADAAFIARMVGRPLQPGAPYARAQLERGLLLANDLPGVSVDGVLQAGDAPGTSDLVLHVRDRPLLAGSVAVGNDGSRYTGRAQAIGRLALDNPGGRGDRLSVTGMRGSDLEYLGASYSLPLGSAGLRGNLGYTALRYRLGKEFEMLDAIGTSRLRRAGLSWPLHRGERFNLEAELAWSGSHQTDDSLGLALRRRDVDDTSLSLYGDVRDDWAGGGWSSWIVDVVHGRARLQLPDDQAWDAAGAGVAGGFDLARLELRLDRWLSADWYARARITGQWAGGNLDSSQQFALGGPGGVRGYPVNEASGDSGSVLQLELHRVLPWPRSGELDAWAFFDSGSVRLHQEPWSGWTLAGDGVRNRYRLSAAGLGLGWTHPRGFNAVLSLAAPVGDNPGGLDGRNQDGTRRGPQFWFNLRQRF